MKTLSLSTLAAMALTLACPHLAYAQEATDVSVVKAYRTHISRSVAITTEFHPYQTVEIHARVSGYVKNMNVDVGDFAKQGDLLATLDIPDLADDLNRAQAAVESAQNEVESAKASEDDAHQIYSRLAAAAKSDPNLIAVQDLDSALDKDNAKKADLQAALSRVTAAKADASRLQTLVEYSKITAPFDGVVTKRYVDTGALIQAGTSGSGSVPLVAFDELKRLRLIIPVPEADVAAIHVGTAIQVKITSTGEVLNATVSRFAHHVDMDTRTMHTEADIPNPDGHITPGMYASASLILASKDNALVVPLQAVEQGETPSVLLIDKENHIIKRPVTIGIETPTVAEITQGIEEGDQVVVGNHSSLEPGQLVNPKLQTTTP